MTTIGRRTGGRRVGTPNNRDMFQRANKQLEGYAQQRAVQHDNALKVDGPSFYFWVKRSGSIPCSCSASGYHVTNNELRPGEANQTHNVEFADLGNDYQDLDSTLIENSNGSLDKLFGNINNDPAYQQHMANLNQKRFDDVDQETDHSIMGNNEVEDVEDAGAISFDDPFNLFSGRAINCPLCMGTGYIDSWQLYGGVRYVFETSNAYGFNARNIEVRDADPAFMVANKRGTAYWNLKLPHVWEKILKIGVFNGTKIVPPEVYSWRYRTSTNAEDEVSFVGLEDLNNTGEQLTLVLEFLEETTFTHAEIVISFKEPFYAQLPELTQGYENEFLDWNVSLSAELPSTVDIREGDYLTESKYAKVWKIGTLTKKQTNGGTVFGQSADLRALHQMEKAAAQFNLFDEATPRRFDNLARVGSPKVR